jgi:festuclavine dehydrogenase
LPIENFSESQHQQSIKESSQIITATKQGKLPFVSVCDIAAVAFHCLIDDIPHNTDYLVLGPALWSFGEVAAVLSEKLKRKITHVNITELELAQSMAPFLGDEYAAALAHLDIIVSEGKEAYLNDVVERVTGRRGTTLEDYVDDCENKGVWNI